MEVLLRKATQAFSEKPSRLTDGDFQRLVRLIYDQCGIRMTPSKKTMLESRLQKRVRALCLASLTEYCTYLFSQGCKEQELIRMIDAVTTNKTDFFRESEHFTFLVENILPEWLYSHGGSPRCLRIWSAGCSTGEEPYSLAMVLQHFAEQHPGFDYTIMATDISTRVLEVAKLAVYAEERATPIPIQFKKKYLLRGKDQKKGLVRLVPELRKKVLFRWLNFMEESFGFQDQFDVIFCRNVIIYFDRQTQEGLLRRFQQHLAPHGHLFLGHSETLSGYDIPLKAVYPTVYRNTY